MHKRLSRARNIAVMAAALLVAGCGTTAVPTAAPNPHGPLHPAPAGKIQSRRLLTLKAGSKPNLVAVAASKHQATLTVYSWRHGGWHQSQRKSWRTRRRGFGLATFHYAGAAPLMGGTARQLVTNYWSTGADAGTAQLHVWTWTGTRLRSALTLDEPVGSMVVRLKPRVLVVSGTYLANQNTCLACGRAATTSITYRRHRWHGSNRQYMSELVHGVPPAPTSP